MPSVTQGRGGKGALFVWASGNGGVAGDDCSADGYVASPETLAIGSISDTGLSTYFSEACPGTMAVIPSGGLHNTPTARDINHPRVKVVSWYLFAIK